MEIIQDKKCQFRKPDGTQCGAYRLKDSLFCFSHDPEKKEEKALAVRKGGLAKQLVADLEPVKIKKPKNVVKLVAKTINEIRTGQVDTKVGTAILYGANILIKALEVADLSERLDSVEKLVVERRSYR